MASKNQKKKNSPLSALVVIIIILGMSGVGAVLIPFIIAGVVVYYYVIKKQRNDKSGTTFDDMSAETVRYDEPLSQNAMFSKAEAKHLATMKGPAHNEYEHYVQELRDLLAAGIIEKDEYRDRVERLRRDQRA